MILPDCVLFPHCGLPLHIFEQRYRQMLQEAIDTHCCFAVVQRIKDSDDPHESAAAVGTVGIIRAAHQQEDGSSNMLLHGIIRVKFLRWLEGKPYPFAEIEPIPSIFSPAHQAAAAVTMIRGCVEDALKFSPDEFQKAASEIMHRTDDPVILADIIAHQFLIEPKDRQKLLEMESPADRVTWLCQHLQNTYIDD